MSYVFSFNFKKNEQIVIGVVFYKALICALYADCRYNTVTLHFIIYSYFQTTFKYVNDYIYYMMALKVLNSQQSITDVMISIYMSNFSN